ncbi:hypothetical protein IAD21_02273 [Abditibacteriota bacterium]|nr:hypothetical protein IAD21_02273 [Abditibacteriota bacterium]
MPRFLPLALGVLLLPIFAQAQPAPTATTTPTPEPTITPETVQQMADRVMKETSAIRHLSIKRPVPTDVKTGAQIEKYMAAEIERQAKPDEIAAANLYLRQLGLAPKTFNIKTAYARLMGEQVAGFYSSRTRAFTTSTRVNPLELETVMAHELTHALQDQHFGLRRLENSPRHESDTTLALSSLVEGDATLVMTRYMSANPLRAFGMLASSLSTLLGGDKDSVELRQAPRMLRETLGFPYISGLKFVTQLHARGGWSSISNAFGRPPKSTQQILHFDQYLANKAPEKVAVPDVSRVLGSGWKLLDHDVNGELGLSLVAGEFVEPGVASAAAAGWAGDRYAVYSGPKGAVLVIQDSLWNNPASASYWRTTYALRTNTRFESRAKERHTGSLSLWNAAPDGVWLEQTGRRVIMLEGTVGAFDAKRVLAALRH